MSFAPSGLDFRCSLISEAKISFYNTAVFKLSVFSYLKWYFGSKWFFNQTLDLTSGVNFCLGERKFLQVNGI